VNTRANRQSRNPGHAAGTAASTGRNLSATSRDGRVHGVRRGLPIAFLLLALVSAPVLACSVPVFRYALLWWGARHASECYQVVLFHRGDLDDAQQALADRLEARAWSQEEGANYVFLTVDLAGEVPEEAQRVWNEQEDATAPWLMLRYPPVLQMEQEASAGPLSSGSVDLLLDSPVRQTIGTRLLNGATAVWVFLESGNAGKDAAALKRLNETLEALQPQLRLPTEADDPLDTPEDRALEQAAVDDGLPPLKIDFSVISIPRDEAGEGVLRDMLRHSETDLTTEYAGEPIIFPVFGQGRALWALVGEGISSRLIEEYCYYLTGMCSCQVKMQNPGFDLLMATNWQQLWEEPASDAESEPTVAGHLPSTIGAVTAAPGNGPPDAAAPVRSATSTTSRADVSQNAPGTRLWWGIATGIGVVGLGLAGVVSWVTLRNRGNRS